jgi:hypothetical protein
MPDRIQTHPPLRVGRQIAKILGSVGMGSFVQRDRKNDGQCVNCDRLDNLIHRSDSIRQALAAAR